MPDTVDAVQQLRRHQQHQQCSSLDSSRKHSRGRGHTGHMLYYNIKATARHPPHQTMSATHVVSPFPRMNHSHARCRATALARAEKSCAERGTRLTELRRRVLELVWRSHEPIKAYEILDHLHSKPRRAAPPTVYRALDFLRREGFVHKIESMNAYVGCGAPGHASGGESRGRGIGQVL